MKEKSVTHDNSPLRCNWNHAQCNDENPKNCFREFNSTPTDLLLTLLLHLTIEQDCFNQRTYTRNNIVHKVFYKGPYPITIMIALNRSEDNQTDVCSMREKLPQASTPFMAKFIWAASLEYPLVDASMRYYIYARQYFPARWVVSFDGTYAGFVFFSSGPFEAVTLPSLFEIRRLAFIFYRTCHIYIRTHIQ